MADLNIDDILLEYDESSNKEYKKLRQGNLYDLLIQAMINERMSPEILPYHADLLREVLSQLSTQQQHLLDSHEYGDMNAESGVISDDFKLQLMIIETDIERLNYLVRLYLRTRLSKLDKFTIHYINETDGDKSLLSAEEQLYIHQHFKIVTQLYNNSFLKRLPHSLTLLDDTSGGQSMVVKPDLNQPVFIKACVTKPIVISLGDDDELELERDGIYVVKYLLIRKYLEIGDVVLI